jgi:adenylate cyclase
MGRAVSYWSAIAVPVALGGILAVAQPDPVPRLREIAFDSFQRASPRAFDPNLPVRIVAIDEASLAKVGQWPWPRDKLAELTRRLAEAGALAIVFDIVFSEADQTSPDLLVRKLPDSPQKSALEKALATSGVSHDQLFAQAISSAPVVLGFIASRNGAPAPAKAGLAKAGDDPIAFVPGFGGAVPPIAPLAEASTGLGAVNWVPDGDSVIRKVPTLVAAGGKVAPSLSLEALRVAQGAGTIVVRSSNASGETAFGRETGVNAVRTGDVTIETEFSGELRLRARKAQPESWLSAAQIIDGSFSPEDVANRIVLVGSVAVGLGDYRTTAVEQSIPGVEVHAQTIEQALTGQRLVRPDWITGLEALLVLVTGLALGQLLRILRGRPAAATAIGLTVPVGLVAASWFAFQHDGLLLDPVVPVLSSLAVILTSNAYHYREAERRRAAVRGVFGRFVTPAVVEQLVEAPERIVLGGELRPLTILFSDIRDFTRLSETRTPQEVVSLVRSIHTPATAAVMRHGGTIDKYIGDGMMAFWNAPLDDPRHARNACLAALELIEAAGRFTDPPIRIGIGIHTGVACVGNLGSEQRLEYSALGDAVNLAARIESLSKLYGVDILVTDETARGIDGLALLELDRVRVKGRHGVTTLFALHAREPDGDFLALRSAHASVLSAYRDRRPEIAASLLLEHADLYGRRYAVLRAHYQSRLDLIGLVPEQEWDGVHTLEHK